MENTVTLSVEGLTSEAELEVLRVSASTLIQSVSGTWVSSLGHGVNTVDLTQSEFVVDAEREFVLVRLPAPKLSQVAIDDVSAPFGTNTALQKFLANFKGNTDSGVAQAMEDRSEAQAQLGYDLASDEGYLKSAEDQAVLLITKLLEDLNPQADELIVEVEFTE